MSTHSSESLFRRGHDPAVATRVEELYESHAGLVRSVCGSLLRDRVETEDAVQQTFLSAQRALANGSQPRDAAAWMATIARHESLARVRSRMREPLPLETEAVGTGPDVHATAVRHEEVGGLREALAELPGQQRDAILLREVRGLSYEEVAANLSVTTSAVESLLFRARRTLQLRLREALAAISPVMWAQPLRDLGAKLLGSGLAAPTAAKVAAVGLGAAVVAGGAAVDHTVIGLGHAPTKHAAPARTHSPAPAATVDPATVWTGPTRPVSAVVDRRAAEGGDASGHTAGTRTETSDSRSSSTSSEREQPGGTGGGTSETSSGTRAGSSGESGGSGSGEVAASGGETRVPASSGGSAGGDSGSSSASTDSGSASTVSGSTSTDSGSVSTASGSVSTDSGSVSTASGSGELDD